MTNEQKVLYLKQYITLAKQYEELEDDFKRFMAKLESPKSQQLSDMPIAPQNCKETLSGKIALIEQYKEHHEKLLFPLTQKKMEIENIIYKVQDPLLQRLLSLRYIDGKGFRQICLKINYSWRHTMRLHCIALSRVHIDTNA
jgi:hypothetical protein